MNETNPFSFYRDASRTGMRAVEAQDMVAPDKSPRLPVTFDAARLIRARIAGAPNFGIVKYTDEILRRFLARPDLSVRPTYNASTGMSRTWFLRAAKHFRSLRAELNSPIYITSEDLPFPLSRLHHPPLDRFRHMLNNHFDILPDRLPKESIGRVFFSPHGPLPPRKSLPEGAARVITVHDVLHLKFPEFYSAEGPPFIQKIIDSIDPARDFVVCVSAHTQKDLTELLPIDTARTRVIHLAADDIFYRHPENTERASQMLQTLSLLPRGYLLALAQKEKRKNVAALINAFASLEPAQRDLYPLVLVSSHAETEACLRDWLASASIPARQFRILVDVSTEDLAALYTAAHLFIFPSLYEGFGIPLVEAMASGCPILASRSSTHPEVLGDAALMFDTMDPYALPQALRSIVDRPDRLDDYRARGLQRARMFSWNTTAEKTAEFIATVANNERMQ